MSNTNPTTTTTTPIMQSHNSLLISILSLPPPLSLSPDSSVRPNSNWPPLQLKYPTSHFFQLHENLSFHLISFAYEHTLYDKQLSLLLIKLLFCIPHLKNNFYKIVSNYFTLFFFLFFFYNIVFKRVKEKEILGGLIWFPSGVSWGSNRCLMLEITCKMVKARSLWIAKLQPNSCRSPLVFGPPEWKRMCRCMGLIHYWVKK